MITVLGSTNLDLIGTVSRIPKPGETVPGDKFSMAAGGKGANQALAARRAGAEVRMFASHSLVQLPHYLTPAADQCSEGRQLVEAVRRADGVILASPGYHGSISGLVKNAIDYLE